MHSYQSEFWFQHTQGIFDAVKCICAIHDVDKGSLLIKVKELVCAWIYISQDKLKSDSWRMLGIRE